VCQSNLRQIGVALQNFESTNNRLPIGARCQISPLSSLTSFGQSWWVDILSKLEESEVVQQLDLKGPQNGWVVLHAHNGRIVDGVVVDVMFCPSSPLPRLYSVAGYQVGMPSYVGISGASSHDGFPESRVNRCCSPKNGGEISAGGVLVSNAAVQVREIVDGTARTLFVGEASDYCFTSKGEIRRIDGGFPNGWLTGTLALGTAPSYDPSRTPSSWNITTIRYPLNTRDYELPGIDDNRDANNPLLSAHPDGTNGLFVDGSVHFLADDASVLALKQFATRDDGFVTSANSHYR
jgi:prepilin-type processing-associated H-X9-DG protein